MARSLLSRGGSSAEDRLAPEWVPLKVLVPRSVFGALRVMSLRDLVSLSTVVRRALVSATRGGLMNGYATKDRITLRVYPIGAFRITQNGGVDTRARTYRRALAGETEIGLGGGGRRIAGSLRRAPKLVMSDGWEGGTLSLGAHPLFLDVQGLEE